MHSISLERTDCIYNTYISKQQNQSLNQTSMLLKGRISLWRFDKVYLRTVGHFMNAGSWKYITPKMYNEQNLGEFTLIHFPGTCAVLKIGADQNV